MMPFLLLLLAVNLLVTRSEILRLFCKSFADFSVIENDKILFSTFRNFTNTNLETCKSHCIQDRKCKSLNMDEENLVCELNDKSSEHAKDNISTQTKEGWTYYSTRYDQKLVGQICQEHKPCRIGTKCYDSCICPGYQCVEMRSCQDWYNSGMKTNGKYEIIGQNGSALPVECDFTSNGNKAWTLMMSFRLSSNGIFKHKPLYDDMPISEHNPNWAAYRLSAANMRYLKSTSSHWRATCGYPYFGFDGRDFMMANMNHFDPYARYDEECKWVEEINIRGHSGRNVTVPVWHWYNTFIHTSSDSTACGFRGRTDAVSSEDNFGYYADINAAFRCTKFANSTTQYWFGGKVV